QGSYLLRADSDDERPRRPRVVERGAVAAVRAGVLSAVVLPLPAAAGRQLRAAGAHRHWTGRLPTSQAVESAGATRADDESWEESAGVAEDSAVERRLPRSGAADRVRHV